MDSSFTILDSVNCKNGIQHDGHDMQITANGEYLLMGSENVVIDQFILFIQQQWFSG